MRDSLWFLGLTGVYFLLQAAQRVYWGGTLEVDEAEMLVMAQGWAWGYGPQLPLYNWAQVLVFGLIGPGTAGLAFLKDAVLWLAAAGMWFAMRAAFDNRRAGSGGAVAGLSAQYHLGVSARLDPFGGLAGGGDLDLVGLVHGADTAHGAELAALGADHGAGGPVQGELLGGAVWAGVGQYRVLAKAARGWFCRFWWRRRLWRCPMLGRCCIRRPAGLGAEVLSADPVLWPWATGLGLLAGAVAAGLALAAIIGGVLWPWARRGMGAMPVASRILLRAAALNLSAAALLVVVFGLTTVQVRWLVPVLVFVAAAGFGWLGQGLRGRSFAAVPVLAGLCAVVTLGGMAQVRQGATARLDFQPLVALVARLDPDRVEGDYFTAGNLKLLDPGREVGVPGGGDWPARKLILGLVPNLPSGISVLDAGMLALTYAGNPDKRFPVEWHLVGP